ncbi:hypothetical protein C1I89_23775 [Achromobacter pulmonis]|uniref:Uncharacterized protein n=1 Tax=Achromobacter pulmonis TaxID=1389932 RepID=A0A2N8KEE4_9BURK|nr:hypothetical protein [Achromobacter pulmonis]PND31827.1 hypothetical protein C1I89_23775 [Achromobacter pulmonis]
MLSWLERFKGWLLLAGLALAALASVFYRGRATGRQEERQERQDQINEQAAQARQEVRNVQESVARRDDDAVADRLKSDWVRGPRQGRR